MKRVLGGGLAAVLCAGAATAGGIERTTQSTQILFEDGNYAEFSFGSVSPSLDGESLAVPQQVPALAIGNVANSYTQPSAGVKFHINEKLDAALIFDKPFGADIEYPANPILGGTKAKASTRALTALLKYSFNDRVSVFGGARHQRAEGDITLQGLAYGAVNGYNVALDADSAWGYVVGAAYEVPEIALRVALTYNSEIKHEMGTTESGPLVDPDGPGPAPAMPLLNGTSNTDVKTPESINLEFQTGIAEDTLLFGSVRHVKHSQFRVDPVNFVNVTGGGLIDLSDSTTYRLGVGRRFTDQWSGAVTLAYEEPGDKLVSPLAPSTGYKQITVAGTYQATEALKLSGGVSYTMVGDAMPETGTPDTARADFSDNDVWAVGLRIGYSF